MHKITRRTFLLGSLAVPTLLITNCGRATPTAAFAEARSSQPRLAASAAPTELAAHAAAINAFTFDMYRKVRQPDQNLVFSPYSISTALAMVLAGARGATAQQLTQALRFTVPLAQVNAAANTLEQQLAMRGTPENALQLNVANALWGQQDYRFEAAFLDTLAQYYGAGMQLLDFKTAPESARQTINAAIARQTSDKIKDLLPAGSIDATTRLVLTNAIYLKAKWMIPFSTSDTKPAPFTLLNGSTSTAQFMHAERSLAYVADPRYQAVSLPYQGGLSLHIILPAANQFAAVEDALDAATLTTIADASYQQVQLALPKFDLKPEGFSLKGALQALGVQDAFVFGPADFSGMDNTRDLFINDALHKATITVDEHGTEAAAATAAIMATAGAPVDQPIELRIDRPFIYALRDDQSGAVLFAGRVLSV